MTARALFPGCDPEPSCILSGDGGGSDGLGSYRYELRIPLGRPGAMCLFILANPSTAVVVDGRFQSDPTVTRCINYAKAWSGQNILFSTFPVFGTVVVANVRAWRETDPKRVPPDPEAIGPENDAHLARLAREAAVVVIGWGKLGGVRGGHVHDLLHREKRIPVCLGKNADGSPKHPLYLPRDCAPIPMGGTP